MIYISILMKTLLNYNIDLMENIFVYLDIFLFNYKWLYHKKQKKNLLVIINILMYNIKTNVVNKLIIIIIYIMIIIIIILTRI